MERGIRLIDSHCHLDFPQFDEDRGQVLEQCRQAGVLAILVPGVRAATWDALLRLCRDWPPLFPALGLHPYFVAEHERGDLQKLRQLLENSADGILAIGEIGLDGRKPDLDLQWELFLAQLDLAREWNKPVVIHSVKTHDEMYAALKRQAPARAGVIHAFSGSYQQARRFVDLGFRLGVGAVITHDRAQKTRDAIRRMPLEALVLESDAPDMPPAGHRGERNSPQWLPEILDCLAGLRQESPERIAEQLWLNACALYDYDFGAVLNGAVLKT